MTATPNEGALIRHLDDRAWLALRQCRPALMRAFDKLDPDGCPAPGALSTTEMRSVAALLRWAVAKMSQQDLEFSGEIPQP